MNELRLEMGERIMKFKNRTKVISWTMAQREGKLKGWDTDYKRKSKAV